MKKSIYAVICLAMLNIAGYAQDGRKPEALPKWENLAPTPQMGWNSWNKFATNISEDLIKATADKMVEMGLDWKDLEFTDEISGRSPLFGATVYNVKDLWNAAVKPFTTAKPVKVTVPSHDVITYKLSPKK